MTFLQSNNNGMPHHFDVASAMYGCMDLDIPYTLITYDELILGKYDQFIGSHLFVGSVEFMSEVFRRGGVDPKLPIPNMRRYEIIKLKDFIYQKPVFVKPVKTKLFSGMVINEYTKSCLNPYDGETEVYVQEVIDIISEFRCYVHNLNVVDIRHYSGDLIGDIKEIVNTCDNFIESDHIIDFPKTFVIDVYYTLSGNYIKTPFYGYVEFNDMWAIGNYGIPNDMYVRMLRDRYFEIFKK